jgi:hypothetical protein
MDPYSLPLKQVKRFSQQTTQEEEDNIAEAETIADDDVSRERMDSQETETDTEVYEISHGNPYVIDQMLKKLEKVSRFKDNEIHFYNEAELDEAIVNFKFFFKKYEKSRISKAKVFCSLFRLCLLEKELRQESDADPNKPFDWGLNSSSELRCLKCHKHI